jgi:hypothetical protein
MNSENFWPTPPIIQTRYRWVPCHHGMARPQVADGEDALQF